MRAERHSKYRFTGLLACAECGWSLAVHINKKRSGTVSIGWACQSRKVRLQAKTNCSQRRQVHDNTVKLYIDALLREMLSTTDTSLILPNSQTSQTIKLSTLNRDAANLERSISNLIRLESTADGAIQHLYTTQIADATQQLKTLRIELAHLERQLEPDRTVKIRKQTFKDLLKLGLDGFWQQDAATINQMLRRLFGPNRLMVRETDQGHAEIIGIEAVKR
ncbi:MAG: recombinase zinc beta ribbon domain-containing protein [Chloroflexota bacterium]